MAPDATQPAVGANDTFAPRRRQQIALIVAIMLRYAIGIPAEIALGVGRGKDGWSLEPTFAFVHIATWMAVLSGLLWYVVATYRPPLRAVFRRLPTWVTGVLLAASWPLAAAHQVEAHWWRHHLPPSLHKGPAPLGVAHLPEAFDGAGTWTSVAGLTCVAAFAVLQVVLFIGAGGGASGGDGRKLAPVFPLNWFSCTLILVANPRMRLAHSVLIPRRILPVDHESDQLPAEEVFGVVTPERYIPSSRRDGTRCPRDLS